MHGGDRNHHIQGHQLSVPKKHFAYLRGPGFLTLAVFWQIENRALELNPDHVEAHQALGEFPAGQNQSAQAVSHYLIVVKSKSADFRVLNNLAVNLDKQGRYIEAIDYYRRALEVQPGNPGVHYNLAVALLRQNDIPTARFHLIRTLEIKPGFAQARMALKSMEELLQRQNR